MGVDVDDLFLVGGEVFGISLSAGSFTLAYEDEGAKGCGRGERRERTDFQSDKDDVGFAAQAYCD